ncbi:MAG: dienelactone hydrolase family protein [Rhizomicrobium sp.]
MQLPRFILLTMFAAMLGASSTAAENAARAIEVVRFESAPQPLGDLQQKQARERGEEPKPIRGDGIQGYLAKPEGDGPFPAVVHLHGCAGPGPAFKAAPANDRWVSQLVEWGYVVLVVDSFSTRNVREACTPASFFAFSKSPILTRVLDAFGGLLFLSHLPYVDRNRVAMLGFSMGGWTALDAASARPTELFDNPDGLKFKATVAFYPLCTVESGIMNMPTLILMGASDDWTLPKDCERMMDRRAGAGAPVDLVIYPGAHHGFDAPILQPGIVIFGHRLEYNAEADGKARAATREFLARQLYP